MKINVCSIIKNEAPYLLEWVLFHKLIGVDKFVLYDDYSTDNTKEVLKPLIDE